MSAELVDQDAAVLGIIHGRHDEMDAAAGEGGFERRRYAVVADFDAFHPTFRIAIAGK
jgi:hypothetical protein